MSDFAKLHEALQARPRPEDVAQLVLEALVGKLSREEQAVLDVAARHSFKRMSYRYSTMSADYAKPKTGLDRQAKVGALLFKQAPIANCFDPASVRAFVDEAYDLIGGRQRLNKPARRKIGIYSNARWYNKRVRLLKTIETKLEKLEWEQRKYVFTRIGKGGLGFDISLQDLSQDLDTACFAAYAAARMGVRSVFTNGKQQRFFDNICEMLLERCKRSPTARWDVIASIVPDAEVVSRLTDAQKGQLLGRWWEILSDMASMLKDCSEKEEFDLDNMVVKSGNDSSTWNQVAGGWNRAREHWISLVHALHADGLLEAVCPGKVMRLMAADVAYWHRATGGDVHPDTKVWAKLPRPWEVIAGTARCNRHDIEQACKSAKVDPKTWVASRNGREAVAFAPTPELVHGVTVSSPALGAQLRKVGFFSGKPLRQTSFTVRRDENGFAIGVEED